ncbi:MAG: molybdopterin-dependent oxidoreductase [Vicinamibacterales bacterium]
MGVTGRREALKAGMAVAGLGLVGFPDWMLPALAQDEVLVPFADMPPALPPGRTPLVRTLDVRTIRAPFTPPNQFYTIQHYGHPTVDSATFRLSVGGLVDTPLSLSIADLRAMGETELVAGFECSGNRRPLQGLSSNGRWTGVPLRSVLERAGLKPSVRELVFFGADRGPENVVFRAETITVEQQFGRSLDRDKALSDEPFLAYALGGEPLTIHQGSPLRLIVPGWYGVSNVKWLSHIVAQEDEYLGNFQARWYRTLRGEMIDGELRWVEAAITAMQLKSFIARVSKVGTQHNVLMVALNDGTPLETVEIKIDDGPWQPSTPDPSTTSRFSWKLFNFTWSGATPGEHTLVSRAIDVNGQVQPTSEELANKKTFLEDNSQHPRVVTVT